MGAPSKILEQIGSTPLVELTRFDTGPCRLLVKLENQNPGGSIKDRIALSMINAAEQSGALKPGGTIVEATAGNTGLGLALVAGSKGYPLVLVIPDKMSREKTSILRAMGAEIVLTRSDVMKGHPDYYQDLAERLAKERGGFYVNQFANPANPLAHEQSTGPEIFQQTGGKVDAVVCGVGSGGTITGLSRYFAKASPQTEMVLADPEGSILTHYIETGEVLTTSGSWLVEGIGEDFIPPVSDMSRVKKAYTITDGESFEAARELLKREGILGGSSTGTLLAAALKYCQDQTTPKTVVSLVCDSGNKYLSKMFNDFWMVDQGFIKRDRQGDLRDFISRRHDEGTVVTVGPEDTLLTVMNRMKLYDVSQLPVVQGEKIVGLIDESDLLVAIHRNQGVLTQPARSVMVQRLETLAPSDSIDAVLPVFEEGKVAIITENEKFLGLITKMDFINALRRMTS